MKAPIVKVIRAWSCFLNYKRTESQIDVPEHKAFPDQKTYHSGEGYYWGKTRCVKIYAFGPYNTRKHYTTRLEVRIDGKEYERTYLRVFTDRGLCLICSRLIRDAEKLHRRRRS